MAMAGSATFSGWRMVAICFLILNCALGVNFAGYGPLVEAIQQAFGTTRALASMGLSMITLTLGLLSPMVGGLLRRMSIRTLIVIGLALNAGGYVLASMATNIWLFLAIYALMIGPGFALSGVVPCTAIVSNWFVAGRGKALGIINMPVGNTLMPMLAAMLLINMGLPGALLGNGLILAALIPVALLLVDAPERVGQQASGAGTGTAAPEAALSSAQILRSPRFLILSLCVALLSAAGITMMTHLVALVSDRGVPLASAAMLLSAFGMAGLVGAPFFGWLSDRIGGGLSFALLSLVQILPWLGLIVVGTDMVLLVAIAFAMGLFSNGILTLFGVTMGEWLGHANIGLAMGLCYLIKMPFMFGAGPLAGAMFDHFGSYTPTLLLHVATFAGIGIALLLYRPGRAAASAFTASSQPSAA